MIDALLPSPLAPSHFPAALQLAALAFRRAPPPAAAFFADAAEEEARVVRPRHTPTIKLRAFTRLFCYAYLPTNATIDRMDLPRGIPRLKPSVGRDTRMRGQSWVEEDHESSFKFEKATFETVVYSTS